MTGFNTLTKSFDVEIAKVAAPLRTVFGYAIICKQDGVDYFDTQDDHIPEDSMLRAALRYMDGERPALDMHDGEPIGKVVFAFPLTTDIAKSLDIQSQRTGLIIGMRIDDDDVLAKFASGVYTGFSIGGQYLESEYIDA